MVSARRARIVRKLAKPRTRFTVQVHPIPLPRYAEQITFNVPHDSPYDSPGPVLMSRLARLRRDG